ncbi:hypothetical protein P5673_029639, partial [Acropora cervicornis]
MLCANRHWGRKFLDLLRKKPCETKTRRVDMLISSQVTKLEVYDTLVESLDGDFNMSVKLTKVHNGELLTVDNLHYQQLIDNSRGGITSLWLNGPEWLSNKENWPPNPVTSASVATEEEAKVIREVLKTSQTKEPADVMDQLLEMHNLRRGLRVNTWVARFIHNCRGLQQLS